MCSTIKKKWKFLQVSSLLPMPLFCSTLECMQARERNASWTVRRSWSRLISNAELSGAGETTISTGKESKITGRFIWCLQMLCKGRGGFLDLLFGRRNWLRWRLWTNLRPRFLRWNRLLLWPHRSGNHWGRHSSRSLHQQICGKERSLRIFDF